jgi:hypothetical protein
MLGYKSKNNDSHRDAVIREITERCATATLSQLSTAAERMSVAQLRGYARAHAWPQIWAAAQDAESSGRLAKSQVNDVAGSALEQTVHLVICAYVIAPVVAMPAPHIGRRAA